MEAQQVLIGNQAAPRACLDRTLAPRRPRPHCGSAPLARHELHAYCVACDRWRVLPLAELVAAGHGERRLPIPVRKTIET